MEDFPGNSNKSKRPQKDPKQKKVERVIQSTAVMKKKPFGARMKELFFGGEVNSVSHYIAVEVLLPAIRNLLVDATSKGVERLVYGDAPARRPSGSQRTAYHSPGSRSGYSPAGPLTRPAAGPQRSSRKRDVNDVLLPTREECELITETMGELLEKYEVVAVADLMDMLGLDYSYVDNDFGWTDLRFVTFRQTREGWLLQLPPVEAL